MVEIVVALISMVGAVIASQSSWLRQSVNGHMDRIVILVLIAGGALLGFGVWRVEGEIMDRRVDDCVQDHRLWAAASGNAELLATPLMVPAAMGDLAAAITERNDLFATIAARNLDRLGPEPVC